MRDKAVAASGWVGRQSIWRKLLGGLVAIAAVAVLVLVIAALAGRGGESTFSSSFPADGPGEFLYLDSGRVIAYLAQLDHGTFNSETLTEELSDTASAKVNFESAVEVGGEISRKNTLSRAVTPTAAANYFELLAQLQDLHDGLTKIGLRNFGEDVRGLTEGQFVTFHTHSMRPPVYLNPYLALREHHTVSTIFPMPDGEEGRAQVRTLREHALDFRQALGPNPRVVFALRPPNRAELGARRQQRRAEQEFRKLLEEGHRARLESPAGNAGGGMRAPSGIERRREHLHEEEHVQYLMPLDAQLLTKERSLIKFGGGEFTVVGKVVRIFPEAGDRHRPAYVDSATIETWAQPLAHAPLALLCRTDPRCTGVIRADGVDAEKRRRVIERARRWDLEALGEQTEIPERGAVILPIAIYK
ncbi:MAG TPA: hypothetical protein VHA54_09210 [Solirubrobacterales bacterium]|nr:hypothetical protein [Solirubrobacterales bacterium]